MFLSVGGGDSCLSEETCVDLLTRLRRDNNASVSRCHSNLGPLDWTQHSLGVECRLEAYINVGSL